MIPDLAKHPPGKRFLIRLTSLCCAIMLHCLSATAWESVLFSNGWQATPALSFETDKLIQDFSFAGYRRGEVPLPSAPPGATYDVVTSFSADPTGAMDSTVAIQNAINAASAAGGGIVWMPAGTYRISPQGADMQCLRIASDNVVLRGAGIGQTFLLNTQTVMRSKRIIDVAGPSGAAWTTTQDPTTLIASNLPGPVTQIPVASVAGFAVGDHIIIRADPGDDWAREHLEPGWVGLQFGRIMYLRQITALDAINHIITVDIPTRYALKIRDNARVYRKTTLITGVALEHFSIGNVQHPGKTGWGESDYTTVGTSAYDVAEHSAIRFLRVRDGWIRNVATFSAAGNSTTTHILNNGILLQECRGITIKGCHFQRPQYGGGGGAGYMYRLQNSGDCLLQNCTAEFSRHGFVFSHMASSGNVIHGCLDKTTGKQTGSTGNQNVSGKGSDHHMHFSHSNLIDDSVADDSWFEARYRPYGTVPLHNLTAAHTVFWNIEGKASSRTYVVHSQQSRYGYVIGTRGAVSAVKTDGTSTEKTAPADHVEGVGMGGTLTPFSLYLEQCRRRLDLQPIELPAVVAHGVSDGGDNAATLHGEVIGNGGEMPLAGFEWWPAVAGMPTATVTVGRHDGIFSHQTTGLTVGTKYEFRAWASNSAGIAFSGTHSWHTPAPLATWPYRLPLVFSDPVGAILTNFPVLVKLSKAIAGFDYEDFTSPAGGADLRFTADFLSPLPYEIEHWDTNGTSLIWVRVPELSGQGETIHALWGQTNAIAPINRIDGSAWNADFVGVWHLGEAAAGRAGSVIYKDSTANNNHGADYVSASGKAGAIHQGQQFATNTFDYITIPNHASFSFGNGITDRPFAASAWVYFNGTTIRVAGKAYHPAAEWAFGVGGNGSLHLALRNNSLTTTDQTFTARSETNLVLRREWTYVAATYSGISKSGGSLTADGVKFFINGVSCDATSNSLGQNYVAMTNTTSPVDIGATLRGYYDSRADRTNGYSEASIDDVRITSGTRPPPWYRAEYLTVASNHLFMTYGVATSIADELLIVSRAASEIGITSATANGSVMALGGEGAGNPYIYVCLDDADKLTGSTSDWARVEFVGNAWGASASFSHVLPLLEPGGNYTYRFHATNNLEQTAWSEPRSFATIGFATVIEEGVSLVSRFAATLHATVTDGGGETPLAGFAWWPVGGSETTTVEVGALTGDFETRLTGLASGTDYEFAAWASSAAGKVWSATNTFSTPDGTPRIHTWAGPDEGDWFTATNWTPVGIPGDGLDTARLTNGIIRLTAATDGLAAFEMTGGTLRFSGWETVLAATNITIEGGTVTHVNSTATEEPWEPNARVYFTGGDLYLGSNATINVDARGYAGGYQTAGRGPGGGSLASTTGVNMGGAGGGHGGAGGGGKDGAAGGPVNGTAADPLLPGSGGGGRSTSGTGGRGGGAVRIEVTGQVTVNGSITADGAVPGGDWVGAGSGGAILIACNRFTGTNGLLKADGGAGSLYGGGGGGGRIAIVFDPASQATLPKPAVTLSARGLSDGFSTGGLGTLFLSGDTILDGAWLPHNGRIVISGWTNWVAAALHMTGWLQIVPPADTHFNLTVTGDMSINGSNAHLNVSRPYVHVGGGLTLANGAQLTVFAASTNASTPEYGALISVTGKLAIGASSWIRPNSVNTNGGSVFMRAGSLAIASGGGINANALGFRGKLGAGTPWSDANKPLGPGAGGAHTDNACGGGYGGRGGRGLNATGRGPTNGNALRPVGPGSGGSGRSGWVGSTGGAGGGVINLEIGGPAVVNGTLTANGGTANHAGGSGGGIFLRCHDLTLGASATLRANGGNSDRLVDSVRVDGGGGGGRIAVWYGAAYSADLPERRIAYHDPNAIPDQFSTATITVNPGTGYTHADSAEQGTIRFVRILKSGGFLLIMQ